MASAGFQTVTNQLQAPGLAGDFASANPRATVLTSQVGSQAGIAAGPNGLTVGLFAWLDLANYAFANNYGAGQPNGFVHNERTALITGYLGVYGMTIPAGFPAPGIFDTGDFFVVNNGATEAVPGMKAYANNGTGVASFAATGAAASGGSGSGSASTIAAGTASVTASIADNVLTVTAVGSGAIVPGGLLAGTSVAANTFVIAQLTGTAGGIGTYSVSPRDQTIASETITATYGTLTIGGTVTGAFVVGDVVSGTGVTAGTAITALGTGTGGAGTYIVSPTQTTASTAISSYINTETQWYCRSFGLPGDVVKISSRAMG